MHATRSWFKMDTLLQTTRQTFDLHTPEKARMHQFSVTDCLMGAQAIFSLKYPSLLQFDKDYSSETQIRHNLRTLYGLTNVPSDTQLRERLDGDFITPIRRSMETHIQTLQRTKALEVMKFYGDYYLVSGDGTEFFSSNDIKCDHCCTKVHNKGKANELTSYHHQMLVGCIVHPDRKTVFPVGFAPIVREDGAQKNDCEQNAGKRWLDEFRKAHPKLPVIFLGDGLYSKAPFIQKLNDKRMRYILVAKEDDHKALYDYFWAGDGEDIGEVTLKRDHITNYYRFMNNVPLNDANPDVLVNVMYNEETNTKTNKTVKRMWVTDLEVNKSNIAKLVKGARTRWKIENETFNTLKTKGYHFEHNFGHGYKGLANVFAGMMIHAFLIDQILEAFNKAFQAILTKFHARIVTWARLRNAFTTYFARTWDAFYNAILDPPSIVI